MPSMDASRLPEPERERRWSLAAAIASVTVFGLSVGQAGPLLSLLLEQRGTDATLNGLNAATLALPSRKASSKCAKCTRENGHLPNTSWVC